jgi:hypothetical protein
MSYEFPSQSTVTAQASTIGSMISGDFQCQLSKALMAECKASNLFSEQWKGQRLNAGVKLCHLNLTTPLTPLQERLKHAALSHVLQSSSANGTFQERLDVRGVLAILKPRAVNTLAAQVVAISGRADPAKGWDGQGTPFRRTWHLPSFERFGETVTQCPEEIRWREAVSRRLLEAYKPVLASDKRCPWSSVYTVFHACRDLELAIKITQTGFAVLASRDAGYYAQGIYLTPDLDYAVEQVMCQSASVQMCLRLGNMSKFLYRKLGAAVTSLSLQIPLFSPRSFPVVTIFTRFHFSHHWHPFRRIRGRIL